MKRTVGIIAPLIDRHQVHMDFDLRIRRNNRELTLAALYDLVNSGFNCEAVPRGTAHDQDIPAAGYYLEGLLHRHGYDTILTNHFDERTLEDLAMEDPIAVCVSTTMIVDTDSLKDLLADIRRWIPDALIVVGGVYVWKNYQLYLNHKSAPGQYPEYPWMLFHPDNAGIEADVLVVSPHGTSSLLLVLSQMENGRNASYDEIPNLAVPGNKVFRFTRREEEFVDYNEDFTRWDLVSEIPLKIPVRTSIGCPYRCRFCDFCHLYPKIFLRSKESLLKELSLITARISRRSVVIHVSDDNVFINKKRVQDVCNAITESGLHNWIGFMRAGRYTENEVELMKRSGLLMGIIGVESGDQGQLERMNKRQLIPDVKLGVELLDHYGISVLMTFVVGFPGETPQTVANTASFLNGLTLSSLSASFQLYPLAVVPLSELSNPALREKWKISGFMNEWSHFSMDSTEALKQSLQLFKKVITVPYHYFEESYFFNRASFTLDQRRSLFRLRHSLTIKLLEKAPWDEIEPILREIALGMELQVCGIPPDFLREILVPDIWNR
jgi:p-methyltransferase